MPKSAKPTAGYSPAKSKSTSPLPHVSKLLSRHLPEDITDHMLRHRFTTVTYQRSKDIRSDQELLGHAKLDTTMIYTTIDDASRKTAASRAWGLYAAA
ncbi:tyrosine-type recombinase/integrase [Corynebacterium auriscanis]|uniref:tyrosine-type recombinase/integrase n=1 Tax=Corynebacterium auriscanis TaxID=99807 RepID=UPI003CE9EAFD